MSDMVLHEGGLEFRAEGDGEPRIRDLDLAERLGFERPVNIRKLIREHIGRLGVISEREITSGSKGGRPGTEYWLTERQALFVTTQSRTEKAADVTMFLVDAYLAVRRQLEHDRQAIKWLPQRLVEAFLLPKPAAEWERMFQPSLVRAICALHGETYESGPHPRHLSSTNRKIYDVIFSSPIGREIKSRNPLPKWGSNHHQHLTPETREYFAAQLKVVEAIARGASDKSDFWRRMDREYAGGLLQLPLRGAS